MPIGGQAICKWSFMLQVRENEDDDEDEVTQTSNASPTASNETSVASFVEVRQRPQIINIYQEPILFKKFCPYKTFFIN